MPLADFAGRRNWGYDGVLWYAPDSAYGRPDDLKALIDEAHLRGLMVFLDVVYNHFGPEGNYLGRYAPAFFTEAQTPWGSVDRLPGAGGARLRHRECAVLAARVSLRRAAARCRQYHLRARRNLAAARSQRCRGQACRGNRPSHPSGAGKRRQQRQPAGCRTRPAAREIPRAVERRLSSRLARAADRRNAGLLRRLHDARRCRTSRARSAPALSIRARPPRFCGGQLRGEPSGKLAPPPLSISCRTTTRSATARSATGSKAMCGRDGDRSALGDYVAGAGHPDAVHGRGMGLAGAIPVLLRFRGRSRGRRAQGRRREYAWAYAKYGDEVPDPLALSTFQSAVLDWESRSEAAGKQRLALVRRPARGTPATRSCPRLAGAAFGEAQAADNGLLTASWRMGDGATLRLAGQPVDQRRLLANKVEIDRHGDLGRRGRRGPPTMVGVLAHGSALAPPAIPVATERLSLSLEMRKPPGIEGRAAWRMSCRLKKFGSRPRAGADIPEYSLLASSRK